MGTSNAPSDRPWPPGQHGVEELPVVHIGEVPSFDPAEWRLQVHGLVSEPRVFGWRSFMALRQDSLVGAVHCALGWSWAGGRWDGVRLETLVELARPQEGARAVSVRDPHGYEACFPIDEVHREPAILAHGLEGTPLSASHGGPLRFVAPERYAWRSVKWVREIEILGEWRPGTWERQGAHPEADPRKELRWS